VREHEIKEFVGDKLQVNRKTWAEALGVTTNQFDYSLANLQRLGLVTKEFRDTDVGGQRFTNIVFIKPVPQRIVEISTSPELSSSPTS